MNARLEGVRVFANTNLAGRAAAGGFDGLYTYDVLLFDGGLFPRLCQQARRLHLLCAPSVGPGYDARRATADLRVKPRRDGARYDGMWRGAVRARADLVTVTSYNEWHEGTQIEPARGDRSGYESYDGAWGLYGRAAETAYLDRTAFWVSRLIARLSDVRRSSSRRARRTRHPASTPRSDSCSRSTSISGHDSSPSDRAPSSAPKQSSRSAEKTPRLPV